MSHQPISLHEIDFSQPDGKFVYKGQTYQIKQYANQYFFRNKKHTDCEFIFLFYNHNLPKNISRKKLSQQQFEQKMQDKLYHIHRCLEYKKRLFSFGLYQGQSYSIKYDYWIFFHWKYPKNMKQDDLLEMPYNFFIDKAKTAYENELFIIEDDELNYSFSPSKDTKPIEFICGSESELKKLTQIAAFTLPELQPLFDQYSGFELIYQSENEYRYGGIYKINTENWQNEFILSKQAQKLFELIFEYNFFTGLRWEYNDGLRGCYTSYDPCSYTIETSLQAPSQHERLEAALELQTWLEGKLPDDEIRYYCEG